MSQNPLPYAICDADNHFIEPPDCFERYIEPSKRDLAIRIATAPDGRRVELFAGRPSRFGDSEQITFSKEELEELRKLLYNQRARPAPEGGLL